MKFSGMIGFVKTEEVRKNIYQEVVVEKHYKGDLLRKSKRWQSGDQPNDDITINHSISIVANQYAYENLHEIKYVVYRGVPWKVTSITDEKPRIVLDVGGVYNGDRPEHS